MTEVNMKVDAFRVMTFKSQKLEVVLQEMLKDKDNKVDLKDRVRLIAGVSIRFEDIERKQKPDGSYYWLVDFINLSNTHGPGKASLDTEIEPFEFDTDLGEKFSYDAALFYDEESEYSVIQYNHQGVKSGAIAKYLSAYVLNSPKVYSFEFMPVIRCDIDKVLAQKTLVKKAIIGIDTRKYQNTSGPLNTMINSVKNTNDNSDHIYIEISVRGERDKSLGGKIIDIVNSLRNNIVDADSEGLTQLKMGVSDGSSGQEILDFINARLSSYVPVKLGEGYRITRDERWNALRRAYDTWANDGNLV